MISSCCSNLTICHLVRHKSGYVLARCHTKNGEFSVKSAYHLEMQRRGGVASGSGEDPNKRLWAKIWQAEVKVKNFAWRATCDGLPTMCTLARRGMEVDTILHSCNL